MLVDGTLADSGVTAGPGSSIEFRATPGSQDFRPTSASRRASKSNRGRCSAPRRRRRQGSMHGRPMAPHIVIDFEVPAVSATDPHTYRIDWTTTGFDYSVDGVSSSLPTRPRDRTDARRRPATSTPRTPRASRSYSDGPQHAQAAWDVHLAYPRRWPSAGDGGLSFTATSTTLSGDSRSRTRRALPLAKEALADAPWVPPLSPLAAR